MISLTRIRGNIRKNLNVVAGNLKEVCRAQSTTEIVEISLSGLPTGEEYLLVISGDEFQRIRKAFNNEIIG